MHSAVHKLLGLGLLTDVAVPTPTALPTRAERNTVGSANDFAFQAFETLRAQDPTDNLCISPLSTSAAFTMAYNGADGRTRPMPKSTSCSGACLPCSPASTRR